MLYFVPKMPNLSILGIRKFLEIRAASLVNTYCYKALEKSNKLPAGKMV